jgi:hypothetical protein
VTVARDYGLTVEAHEDWTLDDIRDSLASGNPVLAAVTVDLVPGGFGHFVVIVGVNYSEGTITYHDPYRVQSMDVAWSSDEEGAITFRKSWIGPVDEGDPIYPGGHRFWGMESYPATPWVESTNLTDK